MPLSLENLASRRSGEQRFLACHGALDVRLASSAEDVRAALRLRHAVFAAETGLAAGNSGLETDRFDPICDHIIVRDLKAEGSDGRPPVVGTYRALRPESTDIGFYSETEFDLAPLFSRHPQLRFCEVGRSCVARTHRSQPTLEALWRGLFVYAARHGIDAYFGVASFPGTDPKAHAVALSWLYHNASGHPEWSAHALPHGATAMDLLQTSEINPKDALRQMPPLLRGYLKIGAHVARSAYIDRDFGTIDVLVIAPLKSAPRHWRQRFQAATAMQMDKPVPEVGITPELL